MSAKTELFNRIKHLDYAVSLEQVIDVGVQQSDHNGAANLIRKGLGIVAFNILEDFIKNKAVEALDYVADTGISFSLLPEKLQKAAVLDVLTSLSFRANLEKKAENDWKSLVQEETLKIQSTANDNYKFSKFTLLAGTSNIDEGDLVNLLKCFGIKGGWNKIKEVSDAINGGVLNPSQSYKNAATRRHAAAHTADFRYDHAWLSNLKSEIIAIAASLDILLSARCRQVSGDLNLALETHEIDNVLNFQYLEVNNNKYRQTKTIGGRSLKNWGNLRDAVNRIRPTLSRKNEFLIVLDNRKKVSDWYC